MHIRIHGGTAPHDEPSLCTTCRSAMIAQGPSAHDEIVRCHRFESRIPFKVTTCSEYVNRQHPSLWHLEDIAWLLEDLVAEGLDRVAPTDDESERQHRLHARIGKYLGTIAGGGQPRSRQVRERVRARLTERRRRAGQSAR